MTIAISAHPTLNPLVGQLADALPIKGLYYPARRNSDTDLPFYQRLASYAPGNQPPRLRLPLALRRPPQRCPYLPPIRCGRPLRRARAQGRPAHRQWRTPSRVAFVCQGTPAAAQFFVCRAGLFAPRGRRPRAGIATGVVGRMWPASPCHRPARRKFPIPSTSLRQPPRSSLPSSADRYDSLWRVDPASRRPAVSARRVDLIGTGWSNLSQRRAQRNSPSQRQGNLRRTRRGNSPGRTSVVARFFGKRECDRASTQATSGQALLSGLRRALRMRQPVLVHL